MIFSHCNGFPLHLQIKKVRPVFTENALISAFFIEFSSVFLNYTIGIFWNLGQIFVCFVLRFPD